MARDVQLAQLTRSRVHVCHVSTAETVDVIRWAKQRGIDVTAEVTPHHLLLTTSEVLGYDPTYKVNPPLRPDEHVVALRDALSDGTIDAVATDHAPHARHDKEHAFAEAAFGMLGLETALAVVLETMINTGPVRLARTGPADVGRAGPHRPAGRPGPPAHGGRTGQPDPGRPHRPGSSSTGTPPPPWPATTPGTAATSPTRSSPPSGPAGSPTPAPSLAPREPSHRTDALRTASKRPELPIATSASRRALRSADRSGRLDLGRAAGDGHADQRQCAAEDGQRHRAPRPGTASRAGWRSAGPRRWSRRACRPRSGSARTPRS